MIDSIYKLLRFLEFSQDTTISGLVHTASSGGMGMLLCVVGFGLIWRHILH